MVSVCLCLSCIYNYYIEGVHLLHNILYCMLRWRWFPVLFGCEDLQCDDFDTWSNDSPCIQCTSLRGSVYKIKKEKCTHMCMLYIVCFTTCSGAAILDLWSVFWIHCHFQTLLAKLLICPWNICVKLDHKLFRSSVGV